MAGYGKTEDIGRKELLTESLDIFTIATCWEEGQKAYHTCSNSWYTLFDGGPWAPWIPSKENTHAPAANEEEDSGSVAIPHLSREETLYGAGVCAVERHFVRPDKQVFWYCDLYMRACVNMENTNRFIMTGEKRRMSWILRKNTMWTRCASVYGTTRGPKAGSPLSSAGGSLPKSP